MAITNFTLNRIYEDYKDYLVGKKISKIVRISNDDYSFFLFSRSQESLILCLDVINPYINISSDYFKVLSKPTPFLTSLKKYFEGGIIESTYKYPNDRIIEFKIKKLTPSYQTIRTKLVIYLIPHLTNLIIVDEDNKIIDALKKSSSLDVNNPILPGLRFYFDESKDKEITLEDDLDSLKTKIGTSIYKDIARQVEEGKDLKDIIKEGLDSKTYYLAGNDILSLKLKYRESREIKLEELGSIYNKKQEQSNLKDNYELVFNLVDHKLKGLNKKLINLQKDIKKNEDRDDYVNIGNLLFMHEDEYIKGSKEIIIDDLVIKLDPTLDLVENANHYFKLYKKSKTAKIELQNQIDITKDKIEFFEKIENQLKVATSEDIQDIILELINEKYLPAPKQNKKKKEEVYKYHSISVNNQKINFGLSSYQNEYLTFKMSQKNDYFLHVKDKQGPHVIISSISDEEVLLTACEVALYYASLSGGEIYLTQVKNVKKVPKKIGLVTLTDYKILKINKIRESTLSKLTQH